MTIKLPDGSFYPHIPTICYCMRPSCYETCWESNYKRGHFPTRKGQIPWNKDKPWSPEVKDKISESHLGVEPWNKGLTKENDERVRIQGINGSKSLKGKIPWNKNIPCDQITKDKISVANTGKPSAFKGKTASIETRLKQSKARKGKVPKCSGSYSRRYHYISSLQGMVCFRSSYEYKLALYLDYNKILWMYEVETFFMSDNLTYTPDFFLPREEIFIDTKGWLRPNSKIKIEKFNEEYSFLNLKILYRHDLKELGIDMNIDIQSISYEEAINNKDLTKINTDKIIKGESKCLTK